jgi:hypothetical protein
VFTRPRVARCMRLTLLGLAISAAIGRAAPARACSPACQTSVAVPSVSSMPGNLVSFKVTLDNPETLSLATAGGDRVATQIVSRGGDRLFEPVEPLAAGSDLVLTYTVCPGTGALQKYAFTTDEPSDIELGPSELAVLERGVFYPDLGDRAIAFVRLRYTPPDAGGNAGHLLEHRASVDGQPTFVTNTDGVLGVDVHTVCNQYTEDFTPGMCGGLYSVPPGRHVVEVQSHFLGEAADPSPVRLTIETHCPRDMDLGADSAMPSPEDEIDVGDINPDGVNPTASLDGLGEAETSNVDADSTSSGSVASGCAFRDLDAGRGVVALGMLLVLARCRRNRR